MGIKKTYTADVIKDNAVKGSVVFRGWFWISPVKIHKMFGDWVEEDLPGSNVFNFRRVD